MVSDEVAMQFDAVMQELAVTEELDITALVANEEEDVAGDVEVAGTAAVALQSPDKASSGAAAALALAMVSGRKRRSRRRQDD